MSNVLEWDLQTFHYLILSIQILKDALGFLYTDIANHTDIANPIDLRQTWGLWGSKIIEPFIEEILDEKRKGP